VRDAGRRLVDPAAVSAPANLGKMRTEFEGVTMRSSFAPVRERAKTGLFHLARSAKRHCLRCSAASLGRITRRQPLPSHLLCQQTIQRSPGLASHGRHLVEQSFDTHTYAVQGVMFSDA